MKYTDLLNNINFNKVKASGVHHASGPIGLNGLYMTSGNNITNIDPSLSLINAVDIDWNGAQVGPNTEINTTGDLLRWIKNISNGGDYGPFELTINDEGYWCINGVSLGVKARGEDGLTPYIGPNGNWWIGTHDTGVAAGGSSALESKVRWIPSISENTTGSYRLGYLKVGNQEYPVIGKDTGGSTTEIIQALTNNITYDTNITTATPNQYLLGTLKVGNKNIYIRGLKATSSGNGGTTPGGGTQYDPSEDIQNALEDVARAKLDLENTIAEIDRALSDSNKIANGEWDRLDAYIDALDTRINTKVTQLIESATWIQEHFPEGIIGSTSNFGEENVEEYLQRIGVWARNGNVTSTLWSDIRLKVDNIELTVAALDLEGTITEALSATIEQAIRDKAAQIDLGTMYAKKDAEKVIEWLYSGLTSYTSDEVTFDSLVSAANNGSHNAISEIRTQVDKLKNGEYVATSSLESKVDQAIGGLYNETSSNNAKTYIFNKIDRNSENIATIISAATPGATSVDIATRFELYRAGSVFKAAVDDALASLAATNGTFAAGLAAHSTETGSWAELIAEYGDEIAAAVVAKVNDSSSEVSISADKINLTNGTTFVSTLFGSDIFANKVLTQILKADTISAIKERLNFTAEELNIDASSLNIDTSNIHVKAHNIDFDDYNTIELKGRYVSFDNDLLNYIGNNINVTVDNITVNSDLINWRAGNYEIDASHIDLFGDDLVARLGNAKISADNLDIDLGSVNVDMDDLTLNVVNSINTHSLKLYLDSDNCEISSGVINISSEVETAVGNATTGFATTSYVDSSIEGATSSLYSRIGEVEASVSTSAIVDSDGNLKSSIGLYADQINSVSGKIHLSANNCLIDSDLIEINTLGVWDVNRINFSMASEFYINSNNLSVLTSAPYPAPGLKQLIYYDSSELDRWNYGTIYMSWLHDVSVDGARNGDVLTYNNGTWYPESPSSSSSSGSIEGVGYNNGYVILDNVLPSSSNRDFGESSSGNRWNCLYSQNADLSGRLDVREIRVYDYGDYSYGLITFVSNPDNEFEFSHGALFGFDVTVDGSLWAEGGSLNNSDERIKENLITKEVSISDIANVRLVDFNYVGKEEKHFGSIAQDWQNIFPNAIKENKKGILGMDYGAIALGAAVTDAREIVALKEENAQLKQENLQIKDRLAIIEQKLEAINNALG